MDHFLIIDEWDNLFINVIQTVLPRPISDHFPIALKGGRDMVKGPYPFRFENMWLKEEGFKMLIKEWWQGPSFRGSYSFIFGSNLKVLKTNIKVKNEKVFGRVDTSKAFALSWVIFWDDQESLRPLNLSKKWEKQKAKEDFKKWALMEEIS